MEFGEIINLLKFIINDMHILLVKNQSKKEMYFLKLVNNRISID